MTAAAARQEASTTPRAVASDIAPSAARCSGCGWGRDGIGRKEWLAIRASILRHVRRTGHAVVANVGHVYTYAQVPPRGS